MRLGPDGASDGRAASAFTGKYHISGTRNVKDGCLSTDLDLDRAYHNVVVSCRHDETIHIGPLAQGDNNHGCCRPDGNAGRTDPGCNRPASVLLQRDCRRPASGNAWAFAVPMPAGNWMRFEAGPRCQRHSGADPDPVGESSVGKCRWGPLVIEMRVGSEHICLIPCRCPMAPATGIDISVHPANLIVRQPVSHSVERLP